MAAQTYIAVLWNNALNSALNWTCVPRMIWQLSTEDSPPVPHLTFNTDRVSEHNCKASVVFSVKGEIHVHCCMACRQKSFLTFIKKYLNVECRPATPTVLVVRNSSARAAMATSLPAHCLCNSSSKCYVTKCPSYNNGPRIDRQTQPPQTASNFPDAPLLPVPDYNHTIIVNQRRVNRQQFYGLHGEQVMLNWSN